MALCSCAGRILHLFSLGISPAARKMCPAAVSSFSFLYALCIITDGHVKRRSETSPACSARVSPDDLLLLLRVILLRPNLAYHFFKMKCTASRVSVLFLRAAVMIYLLAAYFKPSIDVDFVCFGPEQNRKSYPSCLLLQRKRMSSRSSRHSILNDER